MSGSQKSYNTSRNYDLWKINISCGSTCRNIGMHWESIIAIAIHWRLKRHVKIIYQMRIGQWMHFERILQNFIQQMHIYQNIHLASNEQTTAILMIIQGEIKNVVT